MRKIIILVFFTGSLFARQTLEKKEAAPTIERPMLSLGLHVNAGYANNKPFHDSLESLSSQSFTTKNLASGRHDMNYYYGGGVTLRHFLTYLEPVSFLGVYYSLNYHLREAGRASIDPAGDPSLRISYNYSGHKSLNHSGGIVANVFRRGNLGVNLGLGVVIANESFEYSSSSPTTVDSATLKGSGFGGEFSASIEYKLLSFLNLFASVHLQAVTIKSYDKVNGKAFTRAAPEGLTSDNAQLFQMVANDNTDVYWDQNGYNIRIGSYVYFF